MLTLAPEIEVEGCSYCNASVMINGEVLPRVRTDRGHSRSVFVSREWGIVVKVDAPDFRQAEDEWNLYYGWLEAKDLKYFAQPVAIGTSECCDDVTWIAQEFIEHDDDEQLSMGTPEYREMDRLADEYEIGDMSSRQAAVVHDDNRTFVLFDYGLVSDYDRGGERPSTRNEWIGRAELASGRCQGACCR